MAAEAIDEEEAAAAAAEEAARELAKCGGLFRCRLARKAGAFVGMTDDMGLLLLLLLFDPSGFWCTSERETAVLLPPPLCDDSLLPLPLPPLPR